jgi:hypothetical protein
MKRVEAAVRPRCPIEVHAQTEFSVAVVEQREAAFGGEAAAKSVTAIRQVHRAFRVYDCYAAERHLALLGSCYGEFGLGMHLNRTSGPHNRFNTLHAGAGRINRCLRGENSLRLRYGR